MFPGFANFFSFLGLLGCPRVCCFLMNMGDFVRLLGENDP